MSDLSDQWNQLAPAWIREMRSGANANRAGLLDRAMIEACGDINGLDAFDSGCGEGRFSRILLARGARRVVGVDLCEAMISAARDRQSGNDVYHVGDVQDLSFLGSESFHLAVSYLNQCDLPDFAANTRQVFRLLQPGGRFVIANLHPMRSAAGGWHKSESGDKQHAILDRYFNEGERCWPIMGVPVTNFHRALSTYVNVYLRSGFALERIIEPTPDPESLELFPELDDELRVPNFILFVLKK